MFPGPEWENDRDITRTGFSIASSGLMRVTLLFGFAAVALTLVLVPVAEDQVRTLTAQNSPFGVDRMTTGSVNRSGIYTIHRSVLQASPDAICIIRENGTSSGDC